MRHDEPLYSISVAAKLCGVHPQTLRMYERQGLIKPKRVSEKNRMYSEADIERLRRIQRLTQGMGVNLAGVEVILRLLDEFAELQVEFERTFMEMQQEFDAQMAEFSRNSTAPVPADPRRRIMRFVAKRRVDI